ncbi:AbrB/MazE/SpoVT family DNA-binding domain-containing protein [Nocardia sp. NPDC058640]|uniref:AbrB/MazE/SpoVT family DNA-binding domain-containing protein n=1 Tax=Nocardia sp. NPDC058640 TaxID=3346571 RepID=UPI00365459B9
MEAFARLTSNGRVTIPVAVRNALGIRPGDDVHFRVEEGVVLLARTVEALESAGSMNLPSHEAPRS